MGDVASQFSRVHEMPGRAHQGDWLWVREHLQSWLDQAHDSAMAEVVRSCLQGGQWQLAAEVAERVREPGAGLVLQRRLARNMAAMAEHQPLACQAITKSVDVCQYQLVKVEDGRFAVVQQPPQGTALRFGPALLELPESALLPLHEALEKHEAGCGVAICGMGDGALVRHLVKHHWMFWGKFRVEPMVYVIEPDAGLVLHHFMAEDFSQEDGPIRRGNCRWLVGDPWGNDLLELLKQQPTLRLPKLKIPQGRLGKALFGKLDELTEQLVQQLETKRDEIWKRYPVLETRELADLLGDTPSRQPRVMFITSRLTTVLQYANLDCQRAFEAMGWATRLLMEPSAYEDTSPAYLLQQIDDFKPDVLFMIDSLRFHASCVFPPQVLHVCWVQDDLPRLINTEAGQSIGERDFVALPAGPWYSKRFDYPAVQCIFLDKLTHVQSKPVKWVQDGDDLVFVTNAGKPAQTLVREIMDEYRQAVPMVRQLIERVTTDMIRVYDRGNHLHSPAQIRQLIKQDQLQQGWTFNQATAMDQLVTLLFNRFNNALYRQQVVRWLMDIASRHHLKLSLYGSGWSENPEFATHARGTVAYGADLEELTRQSKINMQVVPFGCMHQRLLDGLVAGGFFLVREHPWDRLLPTIWQMVHPVVKDDHDLLTMNAVLPKLQAGAQKQLVELAKLYRLIYDDTDDDPVRRCRDMIEAGCDFMLQPFPDMDHTFFTTSIELEKQVVRYVHDPELRQVHWQKQSAFVETHLTYKAGLGRLMQRIRHRLLSKPNQLRTAVHATGDHLQPMALTASTSFPEGTRSCV